MTQESGEPKPEDAPEIPTPSRNSSPHRTCGIRFSVLDGIFLILGIGISAFLWSYMNHIAFIIMMTVLHFFLFCNVFRIPRRPELIWSAIFLLNAGIGFGLLNAPIWVVAVIQLPVTVYILWRATREPTYHGIGSRRLNTENIDAYLRGET